MTKKDLQAERTRVMSESLGAACHHLGQPATVVHGALQCLQKLTAGSDDAIQDMVKKGLDAATQFGEILRKINAVNEYRTNSQDAKARIMTAKDLQAERTRVMLESLGAACHHLGQPATVVHGALQCLQNLTVGSDDAIQDMVKKGLDATTQIGDILRKINAVNEYRTQRVPGSPEREVIEI